jgi:hypothetical protein
MTKMTWIASKTVRRNLSRILTLPIARKRQRLSLAGFATFFIGITGLIPLTALPAFATMTITAVGASKAVAPIGQTNLVYYYSNISNTIGTTPYQGVSYYIDGSGSGCPNVRNPSCLNSTATFTVQASSDAQKTGTGTMYIIASDHQISNSGTDSGKALAGASTMGQQSYAVGSSTTPLSLSFATICGFATQATPLIASQILTIDSTCSLTNGHGTVKDGTGSIVGQTIYINFVLETANGGTLDSTSDIGSIQLVIDNSIPAYSVASARQGFYQWTAYPGDGEIHIKNIIADTKFPTTENSGLVGVNTVRFYYNTVGFNATLDQGQGASVFDIPIAGSDGSLSKYYVTGLLNGATYYLRAALVDSAGNIGFLTEPSTDDIASHSASPDQIVGLLSKNGNCFIATAAFGTPMAEQVEILRNFRDRYLMKSQAGRNFVSWYYKNSPPLAEKLKEHETARKLVRLLLLPFIAFSWFALKWGASNAFLLASTFLLTPLLFFRWHKTKILRVKKI